MDVLTHKMYYFEDRDRGQKPNDVRNCRQDDMYID